MSDSFAACPSG